MRSSIEFSKALCKPDAEGHRRRAAHDYNARGSAEISTAAARDRYADLVTADRRAVGGQATRFVADCSAAPALFYADHVVPLTPTLRAYLERLESRPSFARVLAEARPYFKYFPLGGLE